MPPEEGGGGNDVEAAVVAEDGAAILDLVGGEVLGGDESAASLLEGSDLLGHGSLVKVVGPLEMAAQRGGEVGLLEGVAFFIEVAIALEYFCRRREAGEVLALEVAGFSVAEGETFGGEFDGWSHVLSEGEFAVVLLGVSEAGDGAGDSAGFVADVGHAGDDVALCVEVHVAAGGGGGPFPR